LELDGAHGGNGALLRGRRKAVSTLTVWLNGDGDMLKETTVALWGS